MKIPRRSIFHKEAMNHYIQEKEKSVLPKIVSPRFILFFGRFLFFLSQSSGSSGAYLFRSIVWDMYYDIIDIR